MLPINAQCDFHPLNWQICRRKKQGESLGLCGGSHSTWIQLSVKITDWFPALFIVMCGIKTAPVSNILTSNTFNVVWMCIEQQTNILAGRFSIFEKVDGRDPSIRVRRRPSPLLERFNGVPKTETISKCALKGVVFHPLFAQHGMGREQG